MPRIIKATDAVRSFSDILNSVKYQHESYTIMRGGKPAAALVPVETSPAGKTLGELKAVLSKLPRLGKDAESFLHDVEEGIRNQPHVPEQSEWE
ncbi:MAG: type II toxin-antitoxin system prevent-host-death family antitoxin [Nitrospiraceae bacterium]|nr:type II toxin-antitoxin system prevent-host-death family antitoxin [Nitrospiraceae bacterium]